MRLARLLLIGALVVAVPGPPVPRETAPATVPVNDSATTETTVDSAASGRLHGQMDAVRRAAGVETLYWRSAYGTNATRIATAAMNDLAVAPPGDDAPITFVSGITSDFAYRSAVDNAIAVAVRDADEVLRYPLHTDGGWSVVRKRLDDGRIAFGVGLVVGWPAPPVSPSRGCAAGYCWSASGLHPHLPWTRNTVKWYLSTANLPAAGESLLKSAIAKVNAVPGFGAHLVYGGRTSVTAPTSTRRFVVVFGSGCTKTSALGCTITTTQGSYRYVFQAKVIVTLSRYRANPSTTWWTGTLMHELMHGSGLGHYDSVYNGSYQLMRSANGPDTIRSGDISGLRRVAPGGAVSAKLTPRPRSAGGYSLVVRTANAGLGGIRAVRTQCTDAAGAWRTVGLIAGVYDSRARDRVVGAFTPPAGRTRYCRAIVRSKTRVYTTARVAVTG